MFCPPRQSLLKLAEAQEAEAAGSGIVAGDGGEG